MANSKKNGNGARKNVPRKERRDLLPPGAPEPGPTPPAGLEDDPLTPPERRFVEEYLIDSNATRAYKAVFPNVTYNTAGVQGSRWYRDPRIRAEINAGRYAQVRRCRLSADDTLKEIMRIAFADPLNLEDAHGNIRRLRDVPLALRRVISGIEINRGKIKYRLCNKVEALKTLCGYLGLRTELPDLEAVLAAIPEPMCGEVRTALQQASRNGSHRARGPE